ncbi:MAG: hypothetical protein ACK54C_02860, partial [Betaproteobacteria bacterium]
MQLIADGRLDLHTPAQRGLPWFSMRDLEGRCGPPRMADAVQRQPPASSVGRGHWFGLVSVIVSGKAARSACSAVLSAGRRDASLAVPAEFDGSECASASSSVSTLPSCMYGAVSATLRRLGVRQRPAADLAFTASCVAAALAREGSSLYGPIRLYRLVLTLKTAVDGRKAHQVAVATEQFERRSITGLELLRSRGNCPESRANTRSALFGSNDNCG